MIIEEEEDPEEMVLE
jgi:hypothetical protein